MKKGLMQVMLANINYLVITVLINFLLPKYLSMESYAMVKSYALYISYVGFFHLGFNDGMYLKYGGKNISEISDEDIGTNLKTLLWFQMVFVIIILIIGLLSHNLIIMAFAVGIVTNNINSYFNSFYQAVGEFKLYGRALNIERILIFSYYLLLLFVITSDNYIIYILGNILVGFLVMGYLGIILNKRIKFIGRGSFSLQELKANIHTGYVLMLGNFSNKMFTGLDRWFVKILMNSTSFAMYAFAVSMESVINVFISPITVSMYNYFCKERDTNKLIELKRMVIMWGFIIITAAFPAKWILENYLDQYISANGIVFILFAAQAFNAVIKGIYVNIYKAEKRQKRYFTQMVSMVITACILNGIFYLIFHRLEAFAIGTLVTTIIWLIICELDYPDLRFSKTDIVAITIVLIAYLFCGYKLSAILGCVVYMIFSLFAAIIFMHNSLRKMILAGFQILGSKFKLSSKILSAFK